MGIIEHFDFCFLNIADFAQIAEIWLCRRKFTVLILGLGGNPNPYILNRKCGLFVAHTLSALILTPIPRTPNPLQTPLSIQRRIVHCIVGKKYYFIIFLLKLSKD